MAEKAAVYAKTPEPKQKNSSLCKQESHANNSGSPADRILHLQRTAGNQAVQRLIKSGVLQAKLKIGQPNDMYEQEADRVAEQVMRMPEPHVSKHKAASPVQRKCLECKLKKEEEDRTLQAKETSVLTPEDTPKLESKISSIRGNGQPLPESVRAFFEPRFDRDFSQVRTHTSGHATEISRSINARAFTVGEDISFGEGQYAPESSEGRRLLAHELTHVVQQGTSKNNNSGQLSVQKFSENQVMRSLALESTVKICHRVLNSRNIKVSKGGLRVVLLLNQLDKEVPNCRNHNFWVTLTRSVDWWPDDEIVTCGAETGGTRSFLFGKLPPGTYYLTIHRTFDNPYCCLEGDILIFDETIESDSSSCIRDKDLSVMDIVHGALDIAGFIPVLGAIPDGINAGIYAIEGDWTNAGLSAVAMVPAWGDGVKFGAIAGKSAIKISEKAAIRLGEEGIAKGLKEVKAASKVEKTAVETAEEAVKVEKGAVKAEKEAAGDVAKTEKEAAEETGKKEKKKRKIKKCSDAEIKKYNTELHEFCNKERKCLMQVDTCDSATSKVAAGNGCIQLRTVLQQKCFSPGDPKYAGHMMQIAHASAALRECIRVMMAKCNK